MTKANEFTTAEMLASLNVVRAAEGKQPLKSWKGSRAALERACGVPITKAPTVVAEGAYPTAEAAERSTGLKGKATKAKAKLAKAIAKPAHQARKAVKAEGGKPVDVRKARTPKAKAEGLVSLADIARELKIEPKVARAKARRSQAMIDLLPDSSSWMFKAADVKKVKAFLTTDQRKGD